MELLEGFFSYGQDLALFFFINAILAVSLNVINGYCGLFSLGHVGFFAVGSYASAVFTMQILPALTANPDFVASHPLLSLVLAIVFSFVCAGLAGLVVGVPCLRLGGDYLAIATIGFSEIIRIVFLNWERVGASRGLVDIPLLTGFWTALFTLILVLALIHNIINSSFGRNILAIREDEIAARSMGVDVRFYKVFAFVLGSSLAGVAGALFAHKMQFIAPKSFEFMMSVMILLMIVVGGIGSQVGAVLGAFVVTILPELLRFSEFLSTIRMLVFGVILVTVMLTRPDGLYGLLKSFRRKKPKPRAPEQVGV